MSQIAELIAQELNVQPSQIHAAINLLDEGSTVPFIARYRKEATEGLDDNHLRHLAKRLDYLRDLAARKSVILTSIKQQNKLTPELEEKVNTADNKTVLEDLYLPFKPKRRTKGKIATEAGLLPLANSLLNNWSLNPEQEAEAFLANKGNDEKIKEAGFVDVKSVLDGAAVILAERFSENASLIQKLRKHMLNKAHLTSKEVSKIKKDTKKTGKSASKYKDYFNHSEALKTVPSHRMLAMLRGKNEGFLQLNIDVDPGQEGLSTSSAEQLISDQLGLKLFDKQGNNANSFLAKVVRITWKSKLYVSLTTEILTGLREQSESEAIKVFSRNLTDVLMAAPAGPKNTLGLDPGLRTGCKLAVVDATGKLLHTSTIFPHAPQNHWDKSVRTLLNVCRQYKVELVAIGNGTGSRESDKLVAEVISQLNKMDESCTSKASKQVNKVLVSEAGASIYSASELAAKEFPTLDVSLRGAVSIARRLQDPLAELVKIDPKAIGVGQYQHDVSQSLLSKSLDEAVEDCVNAVGVDLNSASAALLARVSGLNKTMANNIVEFRDQQGRFNDRKQLKKVARLGPKAFEQAAGFLRINDGDNPLDKSGVHPETYTVVEKIIEQLNITPTSLFEHIDEIKQVNLASLTTSKFGEITVKDVIDELVKPNRDPRPEFKTAIFVDGVHSINDLKVGMVLEGVISNVANFGAFVDIGVHQDGLVHISSITNKFIKDPREVIKAGDIVKVKVTEVDTDRKRISLTMRLDDDAMEHSKSVVTNKKQHHGASKTPSHDKKDKKINQQHNRNHQKKPKQQENAAMGNAFADAFAKLKK
jgi:uncharacterized protein